MNIGIRIICAVPLMTFFYLFTIERFFDQGVVRHSFHEGVSSPQDGNSESARITKRKNKLKVLDEEGVFCSCRRENVRTMDKVWSNRGIDGETFPQSTCSDSATRRGPHQNVISYSYFSPNEKLDKKSFNVEKYLKSLLKRIEEVKRFYPKWVVRIYHNVTTEDATSREVLCEAYCKNSFVDLCDVRRLPCLGDISKRQTGTLWRFAVMGDPTIDTFMCRDSDSIIQKREVVAVNDWFLSNKTYHVMRDHPDDKDVILAGLWGGRNSYRMAEFAELRDKMIETQLHHYYGYDQDLLKEVVWPSAKMSVLQHDSFTCEMESHFGSVPFPSKRDNEVYVGWGPIGKEASLGVFRETVCPLKCRPSNHPEWTKC